MVESNVMSRKRVGRDIDFDMYGGVRGYTEMEEAQEVSSLSNFSNSGCSGLNNGCTNSGCT